jgi:crossover junction endodeoxyribonuclease RusA
MTKHVITLPWSTPPLSLNDRRHWAAHATIVDNIRQAAGFLARAAQLGRYEHVTVTLHYRPRDKRTRDADNLVAVLKPLCDGLVDAQLVTDDDPERMTKHMPKIHPPQGKPVMWMEIDTSEGGLYP